MSTLIRRRDFARLAVGGLAAAPAALQLTARKRIPIGLQLYSIRKDCAADLAGSLAQVAKMGYEGVEFAGYYGHGAQEIRKMLDANGLKCCGIHTRITTLEGDELKRTIEFNQTIGNTRLNVAGIRPGDTAKAWYEAARRFSEIAAKLAPHGMRTGYHCHARDFQPVEGKIPWEIIFDNTPKEVNMQLDVGHCVQAGSDPLHYLKKYPGRARTIHVTDYSPTNNQALLGEGVVPLKQVFQLCETVAGTEWYIIEQERYPFPPMECARRCLENMKKLLA